MEWVTWSGIWCQALPALPVHGVEHPVGISWEYPKIRRHKAEEEEAEAKRSGKLEMLCIPKDRVGRESRKYVQYR